MEEYEESIQPEINVEEKPKNKFWKLQFVIILLNLGFVAILAKLLFVQVIDADRYKERAKHQHESKVILSAERGNIYDRQGRLIVSTVQSMSIAADPKLIKNKDSLCKQLEKILGIPSEKFLEKINSTKSSFVWLMRGILPSQANKLNSIKDSGLIKISEPRRNYLYGSVASQIIGCTNIDNCGLAGIELDYDSLLSGRSGYMIMQRDGRGRLRPSANMPFIPAIHGISIKLTIDIELQRIVEYELKQGVLNSNSASGTAIAIEPATGEILAMASYPSYDQNNLTGINQNFMRNRAITDVYEPGSTFKLITASAALEERIIKPTDIVNGYGGILNFTKYVIKDDHPIGMVTFAEALEQSSNVVFSQVAYNIQSKKFYKYLRDFGFGKKLGINIAGEISGKIRKPKELDAATKRFLGFGYGLLVTPLQMAVAYSTIANSGVAMKPYIVKSKIVGDEEISLSNVKTIKRVVSESTANTLKELLCGVVERGTGKAARINGIRIAGKTGTSQQLVEGAYSKKDYNASFAGFFPADNPKVALLILLEKPQGSYYGGTTAAPIFRNIAARWIAITPDLPIDTIKTDSSQKKYVYVPNICGLYARNAKIILDGYKLRMSVQNPDAVVISQSPSSGYRVVTGTEIKVTIKSFKNISDTTIYQSYRPDVKGLTLRRALTILNNAKIKTKIVGSGIVREQKWDKEKDNKVKCTLICR